MNNLNNVNNTNNNNNNSNNNNSNGRNTTTSATVSVMNTMNTNAITINQLLKPSSNNKKKKQMTVKEALQYCHLLMTENGDTQKWSQELKNATKARSRCVLKWHSKHVAYRCKTCEKTTSSCICVDCFNRSNHEGHDYSIFTSESGGCCDCGDPLSWDKEGFCERHSGKMNFILPKGFKKRMKPVVHAVVCNFVYYLSYRGKF